MFGPTKHRPRRAYQGVQTPILTKVSGGFWKTRATRDVNIDPNILTGIILVV